MEDFFFIEKEGDMQEETAATPFQEDISLVPGKLGRSQDLGLELDARNYFHWR